MEYEEPSGEIIHMACKSTQPGLEQTSSVRGRMLKISKQLV